MHRVLAQHRQSVPNPSPGSSGLAGVAATSARNAWAVGDYATAADGQTLILHWNGIRWRRVPAPHWNGIAWRRVSSPNPGGTASDNYLFGAAALSARSMWAVGGYFYVVSGARSKIIAIQSRLR